MAILDKALDALVPVSSWTHLSLFLLLFSTQYVYKFYFHPLRHIPGPQLTKYTSLWLYYHAFIGDQCTVTHKLHRKYGPVVRIGPNEIDISKGEALGPLYIDSGGFEKSSYYSNLDIDGHASIFSTLTLAQRAPSSKAVLPLFSTGSIREGTETIAKYADTMIDRMRVEQKSGAPVDVLQLARSFALDVVCAYLFRRPFRAMEEKSSRQSVSLFLSGLVGAGGLFYLPGWMFVLVGRLQELTIQGHGAQESVDGLDCYYRDLIDDVHSEGLSFPGRLLSHKMSREETVTQCKDAVFAGTETTGINLAFMLWSLAAHPKVYESLLQEIEGNKKVKADMQSLSYLTGVVKETLRLSLATPCRLPRVVPSGGWTFDGYYIPEGTNVGVAAWELHLNPAVFPHPDKFLPERWLEPTSEMNRDWMPFGKGARGCIARNMAMTELYTTAEKFVESGILRGARSVEGKLEKDEWFNIRFRGDKIELFWPKGASEFSSAESGSCAG